MTVRELKQILSKLDPDKNIVVSDYGYTVSKVCDVKEYTPGLYSNFKNADDVKSNEYISIEYENSGGIDE